jgi:hypothetical protein
VPKPRLTVAQILAWADAHRRRTGRWPGQTSGPVAGVPGQTWAAVVEALRRGLRGLPEGDTLARLLARERGVAPRRGGPRTAARRQAAELRAAGLSLAEIGRRLGVSKQRVHQLLHQPGTLPEGAPHDHHNHAP